MEKRETYLIPFVLVLVILFSYVLQTYFFTGASAFASGTISIQIGNVTVNETNETNVTNASGNANAAGKSGIGGGSSKDNSVFQGIGFGQGIDGNIDSLQVLLHEQVPEQREYLLRNLGELTALFSVSSTLSFLDFDPTELSLRPGESIPITLFFPPLPVDVFVGKLVITSPFFERFIPLIVTVQSKDARHHVALTLLSSSKSLFVGSTISLRVSLRDLSGGTADVTYILKDAQNKDLLRATETRAVGTSLSFTKDLKLPSYLKPGTYVLVVLTQHQGKTVAATSVITLRSLTQPTEESPAAITPDRTFLIFLLFFIFVCVHYFVRKRLRSHT